MNDHLTTRLRDQLHDQVDGWHTAPLTIESVRGRAHAIRRTRRVAAAGVAAVAVAAIVVPTAMLGDTTGRSDRPPEIAETPTEASEPGSGLAVPYLVDRTLTMPDGSERELPKTYREVVTWDDEVLGITGDPGTPGYTLERLDEGTVEESVPLGGSSIARNADGSAIAYVTPDAHMMIEWADGQVDLGSIGGGEGLEDVRPVRLFGGPDCDGAGDCDVYFEDGRTGWIIDGSGGTAVGEGALAVHDVSENGLVSVLTSIDDTEPGSCSEIRDLRSGESVFETCDHTPAGFSPDGTHLTALPPYLSGIGPSRIAILDAASGEELAAYEPDNGYVSDSESVWEDADHLLTTTYDFDTRTWSVVRLGVDGSRERVLGPTRGRDTDPPWTFVGGW